ncbi:hypothetical protein [Sulfurimonas sp.]|uniref:hypothetical protein n=1 Tax=Sulfurimonas sp. TaxID=2022749 RepID=UPI0025FC083E|nr:hypothetical protein [Sulfurimonas sp.]
MKLCIAVDTNFEIFNLQVMSIAGKEIIEYWLEWARYKAYDGLYIYTSSNIIDNNKIKTFQDLYGVKLVYQNSSEEKIIVENTKMYNGIGIFLDNGDYRCFQNMNDILAFEQELIYNPLNYCSSVGYGKSENIHIGKNVYIHESVKLLGAVIIGDNCTIEKGVEIQDSVIDKGCLIKNGSTLKNSHISQNIHLTTKLYLKDKALFESNLFDIKKRESLAHDGICLKI